MENNTVVMKVLVITCGGQRMKLIEKQFSEIHGFEVHFSRGIDGRRLADRLYFEDAVSLLVRDLQRGENDGWDLTSCWEFVKKMKVDQRCVLGNFLAHIRAMKEAVTETYDLIIEDGARCVKDAHQLLLTIKNKLKNIQDSDKPHFVYLGYLGSVTNLELVYSGHLHSPKSLQQEQPPWFQIPVGFDSQTKKAYDLIWGSYAYIPTTTAYTALLSSLRNDIGSVLWRLKKGIPVVKPIDKVMPRHLLSAGLQVVVCSQPVFFRSPGLKSQIHPQWDIQFVRSTTRQLELTGGRTWEDVWLDSTEQEALAGAQRQLTAFAVTNAGWSSLFNPENSNESVNNTDRRENTTQNGFSPQNSSLQCCQKPSKKFSSFAEFQLEKDASNTNLSVEEVLFRVQQFLQRLYSATQVSLNASLRMIELVTPSLVIHILCLEDGTNVVIRTSLLNSETVFGQSRSEFRRIVDKLPGEIGRTNKKWRRILERRQKLAHDSSFLEV